MLKKLKDSFGRDRDYPQRTADLQFRARVLDGSLYDKLPQPFHTEKTDAGEYVPLRDRRPCVRYRLCSIVVDDSVSLLFSEGHFPAIECEDAPTKDALLRLVKEAGLNRVMIDAATRGSVGSVALLLRVLERRVFVDVLDTPYLTPKWRDAAPDTLERVTERYKAKGSDLIAQGYTQGIEAASVYWWQREWTDTEETWYAPQSLQDAADGKSPVRDAAKSVVHNLGFVPMLWVRNLPGCDGVDGCPTFPDEAIETGIEIDYQLSQAGRGLKYSSDPQLLIKEPAVEGDGDKLVRSAGNALVVDEGGDAKLLEINGTAAAAVLDYVKFLRELALESMHGNRSNADKLSAAQSGRALELMHQSLIWLADRLRVSYGEGALLELLQMIVAASAKVGGLVYKDGSKVPALSQDKPITLRWPQWFAPTPADMQAQATTLNVLTQGGMMSTETAVGCLSSVYDVEDTKAELTAIAAERTEREKNAQKQVKITE